MASFLDCRSSRTFILVSCYRLLKSRDAPDCSEVGGSTTQASVTRFYDRTLGQEFANLGRFVVESSGRP